MGSPADFVPGAWIQFLRIDGTQLTDPIVDQKSLHAPITEVIPQLDFLHATIIRVATDTVSESRERRRADYRNPTVAEVLRNLDFVQRFGVGITLARQELAANGNPPPEFLVSTTNVLAVLRKAAQDAWAEYRQLALKIVRPLALPE